MVSLLKEVYGEAEFNKHNDNIDWDVAADRCFYVTTPEQGPNECGFYALKVILNYNGEKLVEKFKNKDVCFYACFYSIFLLGYLFRILLWFNISLYFLFLVSIYQARVEDWKAEYMFQILFHPKNIITPDMWPSELKDLVLLLGLSSQNSQYGDPANVDA